MIFTTLLGNGSWGPTRDTIPYGCGGLHEVHLFLLAFMAAHLFERAEGQQDACAAHRNSHAAIPVWPRILHR